MTQLILIGMPEGPEWIFIFIALAAGIFWLKTVVEIATGKFKDDTSKIVWLLVVLLTGIIGAIIYVIAGRQSKMVA